MSEEQALRFEANVGQHDDASVRYVARRNGATLSLTDRGALLTLANGPTLSLRVPDAPSVDPVASRPLATKTNYLVGNDPAKWHRDVPTFAKVTYPGVANGVDLVFHGEEGQLEYDFDVAPGANVGAIGFEIGGVNGMDVDADGNVALHLDHGDVIQRRPRVFQRDDKGAEHEIAATYRLKSKTTVGFEVAAYDRARPLVIDPVIEFASYLGGSGADSGYGVTVGGDGAEYVTGSTSAGRTGAAKRGPGGGIDAFVAKVDGSGNLAWFTYFGGSLDDSGSSVAVDASGRATSSTDFPTASPLRRQVALRTCSSASSTRPGARLVIRAFTMPRALPTIRQPASP